MISASQAEVVEDTGGLKLLTAADTGPLRLTEYQAPLGAGSAGSARRWATRSASAPSWPTPTAPCATATGAPRRTGRRCPSPRRPPARTASPTPTPGWSPGAVTTSGDADDDGRWGRHRVILSAWSRADGTAGQGLGRVSVDADHTARPAYASALLVVPVDGGQDYRALSSPVSGMVWYQDKLLVTAGAGDRAGLYVYDLDRIQRATAEGAAVGRVPGGRPRTASGTCCPPSPAHAMSAAPGAALRRFPGRGTSPASLVAGESVPADAGRPTRLWRYALSADPARRGLPAADADGHVDAREAYETRATAVGGVLSPPGGRRPRRLVPGHGRGLGRAGHAVAAEHRRGAHHRVRRRPPPSAAGAAGPAPCRTGRRPARPRSQSGRMLFALPLSAVDGALG
ncbi:Secreted protein OS=Streptomyces fumanus OX=67302 GN=GCM10018772_40200 PE=4 SV=1 [Streptomyces fumanus]